MDKPNYKIGDKVVCIYKKSFTLIYGKKYIVYNITKEIDESYKNETIYYTQVEKHKDDLFFSDKFVSEIEWETMKFNI